MLRITAGEISLSLPNITGEVGQILESYHIPLTESSVILIDGAVVGHNITIAPDEDEDLEISVTSSDIRVVKQVGEFADQTIEYQEGMTIQDALNIAMERAGLTVNTDGLTCMDYSRQPNVSYPAGLRSEKVRPGAALHLITTDKNNRG